MLHLGEIHAIIASEQDYEDRVKSLENELGVFKQACLNAENEKRVLKERLEKLESQLLVGCTRPRLADPTHSDNAFMHRLFTAS